MLHILLDIGWFAGWVLGIIGFFTARRVQNELKRLQTTNAPDRPAPTPQEPTQPAAPKRDLEALITMNWGIWLGSAALLFAGVFLVRYAVEQSLLGPSARCGLAALLGLLLLAAAEWLHRHEGPPVVGPFRADQAPAGLAAGGTAILFGAAYGAGPFFALLPPVPAFAAMAAASLIALASALRYGPLTAATGIVGAFATPALVATQSPALPALFGYLLLVSFAANWVVRRTAWTWLGWATAIAGAAWVCFAAVSDAPAPWAASAFVAAAPVLHLALLPGMALQHKVGRRLAWVPFAILGLAGLALAVFNPNVSPRLALFLLSPIAVAKAVAEPRLDRLPWVAALFGLAALLVWPLPAWTSTADAIRAGGVAQAIFPIPWAPAALLPLIAAAVGFAMFHTAAGLWQEQRAPGRLHWAALPAAVPVLTLAVAYGRIQDLQPAVIWAMTALALATALTGTATLAARAGDPQRAAVHAAGAVAALALG